jgi:hypothetical protein
MPFIWLIITFIIAYFIYKISKVQKTNQCLLESPKNYYFGKENISGIPIENVQFTIDTLELNVQRLKDQRLVVIDEINKELDDETIDINDLEEKIAKYKNISDDYCICNNDDEDCDFDETPEDRIKVLVEEEKETLLNYNKLNNYTNTAEFKKEIQNTATELSLKYVIDQKIEKLKNCFVMEKTPLGNVIMTYNNSTSSFSYHSDNTIPYRYLETVARKFVKTFNCRPIFIIMDEELKKAEEKWETERSKNKNSL